MQIKDKLQLDKEGLIVHGPINIAVFGDSVTHGAVGHGEIDYETVYWNRLRKKLLAVRDYVPINVINAGIGGIDAKGSVGRVESQVLCHRPDLIIVCFGLNDVNGTLEDYLSSLQTIFEKCKACEEAQTVFLTPNMLNTTVAEDTAKVHWNYAHKTAEMQNSGRMDTYIYAAIDLARSMGIEVCDCYSKWKELSKTQDITCLLANRINHPTREMHELFAQSLFELILPEEARKIGKAESTMYRN